MSTSDLELEEDVFIIHKHENPERLKKWRQATLVLNATRRFRYTLNLEGNEEARNVPSKRVRASTQVIRAVQRFREAGARATDESPPANGFGLGPRKLHNLVKGQELNYLQQLGGVLSVAKSLRSDLDSGLNEDVNDMIMRKKYFGENNYPRKHPKSFFVFAWEAAKDTTLIILMFCAAVSLVTGMTSKDEGLKEGWYDGTSITIAILIVVLVTAISDYKQSLEFQVLNNEKKNIDVQVVRMCRTIKVSIFDLVVGDVVSLNIGDQVPADGLLIKGHSLSIDESSLTGESELVLKDSMHPFLLSGCKVADGYGLMLVTGVGLNTEWGQIMAAITEDTGEETPLQVRLNGTATFIGKVGLIVAALVFVVLFIRYFTDQYSKSKKASEVASSLSQIFAIAVVIVVIAVPEGLPLAVTLTLAYSMKKMMEDKSLVRHLSACETMGSATIICSDKTGTLTLNEASFQLTVLLTLYYKGIDLLRLDGTKDRKEILRDTIIFNTFVFCQLFNEINARKPEEFNIFTGILKNHMFVCVTVLSIIFQVIMVEFLNKFAKTTKLSWKYWIISIGIGFLSLPIGYLLKLINVPKKPFITTHKVKRKRRSREDPNPYRQSSNEQLDIEQPTRMF